MDTFTEGLITTPLPTFAPKIRSSLTFSPDDGFQLQFKNKALIKYQVTTFNRPPPTWNHELSYLERSVCTILIIIETYSDNAFGFRHC